MASNYPLRLSHFCNLKAIASEDRSNSRNISPYTSKINVKDHERRARGNHAFSKPFLFTHPLIDQTASKWIPGSLAIPGDFGQNIQEDEFSLPKSQTNDETEFNRVNCLVWLLHESARSFSLAVQKLELATTRSPLAMAWNGVDVSAWHKHISYQVAVYALLNAAIEVELFLSHNRSNNPSPVHKILSPNTTFLGNHIESLLNTRNRKLVQWFRMVELPRVTGLFMPLFKKWSVEYAGSGVAGTIVAITCCAAIGKLGSGQSSFSSISNSTENALIELMTVAHDLVSIDKLHHLATEAGFEENFLFHFGRKVLPNKNIDDIEFWIGLVQRKLLIAFQRESVTEAMDSVSDKIEGKKLNILGLFAYLGRTSRLFLSRHGINDVDDQILDFLSYLECGILFLYPDFATLSQFQLLMEVMVDEIGWLDFYAAYNCPICQDRRRNKQHPIQAEKEIILYAVFTVCYDVISGFAHYNSSTQQTLESDLLEFLIQSQGLLSACLEDYWAAYDPTYDRTSNPQRIGERNGPDSASSILIKNASLIMDGRQRPDEMRKREKNLESSSETPGASSSDHESETLADSGHEAKPIKQNFLKKYADSFVADCVDVWMGTQLLFVDFSDVLKLLKKKLRGHKVTKREGKKIMRMLCDIVSLIPVTILMLLPVSAVGHAAMFAAIKRYIPCLIPSPYSEERIDLVRQLKRTKKMEIPFINTENCTAKVA